MKDFFVLKMSLISTLFFSYFSLPDSPAEPDMENEEHGPSEPKLIPHDEVYIYLLFLLIRVISVNLLRYRGRIEYQKSSEN